MTAASNTVMKPLRRFGQLDADCRGRINRRPASHARILHPDLTGSVVRLPIRQLLRVPGSVQ